MLKNKLFISLLIISFFGFVIRLAGIYQGYPFAWHPDEWRIVLDTLAMGQKMTLISQQVNYPLLYKYTILFVYGLWFIVGKSISIFSNTSDFAKLFFSHPEYFMMIPRYLNLLFGSLMIPAAYCVGRKYFDTIAGIFAALYTAFEFQLVLHSQVGVHQTLAALTTLPIFYFAKKYLDSPNSKNAILLGAMFGVGVSAHHTTILLAPCILTVFFIAEKYITINFNHLIKFSIIALCFGVIGNLNWIFKFDASLRFLLVAGGENSKIAFASLQSYTYSIPSMAWWLISELIRQDYFIGIIMVFSLIYSIIRRRKEDFIYLTFIFTNIIFFYNWGYRQLHLLLSILPIMLVYAGGVTSKFLKIILKNKPVIYGIFVVIILISPNILSVYHADEEKMKIDTRDVAKAWVEDNISTGSTIAIDWSGYNIDLNSDPPSYLRNLVAEDYYNKSMPINIKTQLRNQQPQYKLIDAFYNNETPIWPKDMPRDTLNAIKKKKIFNDLYAYFNFLSLDQVAKTSDYLIITSYSYSMYLVNGDPHKTDFFNIYLKDDVEPFYSQGSHPTSDMRHGPMFYLAERGRKFYLPLLNNTDSRFILIKKFSPSTSMTGPIILIYKIKKNK